MVIDACSQCPQQAHLKHLQLYTNLTAPHCLRMVAGLLDVGETLLLCTDGSGDEQQLSLSSAVDLLPPAVVADIGAAEHISEASWCSSVQQLQACAGDRSLITKQQVRAL